jgi:hypothetical protein
LINGNQGVLKFERFFMNQEPMGQGNNRHSAALSFLFFKDHIIGPMLKIMGHARYRRLLTVAAGS